MGASAARVSVRHSAVAHKGGGTAPYKGGIKISYAGFSSMNGLPAIINTLNRKYAGKYYFSATAYPYANYAALLSSAAVLTPADLRNGRIGSVRPSRV